MSLNVETGVASQAGTMFVSSREATLLEYFRVPYEIDPLLGTDGFERVRPSSGGAALL